MQEPSDDSGCRPVNRLVYAPSFGELIPTTSLDSLLTKDQAQQLETEQRAFEAVGDSLDWQLAFRSLYPILYEYARDSLVSGGTRHELLEEIEELGRDNSQYAVIMRLAYGDVLEGRPPRRDLGRPE